MPQKRIVRLDVEKELGPQLEGLDGELQFRLDCRLQANGYCLPGECEAEREPEFTAWQALAELHAQAHPGENTEVVFCRLEPCRSIPVGTLWSPS